ncbi:cupin domain-containing protein [Spirosoma sp. HMF4905]|uniref:Cupin domain-containing protein n=1 Tax=Spirosoma arboris TaxID=2682092 RepID=A0A7K1S5N1_9BACT|nr:cupin domain-containing protein [Spirosoma arboris]MVM29132.1 cupin domain-containing protein [Spirosoma arboris]
MEQVKNQIQLPLTIVNGPGDVIIFQRYYKNKKGQQAVEVENTIPPKGGPPMHVHYRQDESLTVIAGTMGIKEPGQPERYITVGQTVVWKAGQPHKFWNAGTDTLHCTGWVAPVDSFIFLLSEIHKSVNAGNGKPSLFDIAYLMRRYKSEFYMLEIPAFVQATFFPFMIFIGSLLGKYKKYADAPEPVQ